MWNNLVKSKMINQQKKVSCIAILFLSSLVLMLALPSLNNLSYAQTTGTTTTTTSPDPNMLIVMVNIERIRNQILLTERSLAVGDNGMAFAHSYIPHSAIFPSIKNQLNDIKSHSGLMLESLLTDLPIIIKTSEEADSKGKIKNDLTEIEELLDNISNQTIGKDLLSNKTMIAHTIVFLLRDAGKSYQLSNAAAVAGPIDQQQQQTDNNKTIQ